MIWFHGNPSDCPSPRMVADLTLTGGGNYEPTGTQHAECSGHCQHVWVEGVAVKGIHKDLGLPILDIWETCRDCGEVR